MKGAVAEKLVLFFVDAQRIGVDPFFDEHHLRQVLFREVGDDALGVHLPEDALQFLQRQVQEIGEGTFLDLYRIEKSAVAGAQDGLDEFVLGLVFQLVVVELLLGGDELQAGRLVDGVGEQDVAGAFQRLQGAVGLPDVEAEILGELHHVEVVRLPLPAADGELQVAAQRAVGALHFTDFRVGQRPVLAQSLSIRRVVEHRRVAHPAVAAAPAGFLEVGFRAVGRAEVDDAAHVGFVDPHAEGIGGYDDAQLALDPGVLPAVFFLRLQAGVVAGRGDAAALQIQRYLLGHAPAADVHDARARHPVQDVQQLLVFRLRLANHVGEVIPPEALFEDEALLFKLEVFLDVFHHFRRRRGGNGDDGHVRVQLPQLGDAQVRRPEVVAPLADAVGFVDGQQRQFHLADADARQVGQQALRTHVQQFGVAVHGVVEDAVDVVFPHPAVDRVGHHAPVLQLAHLVFHQRDER